MQSFKEKFDWEDGFLDTRFSKFLQTCIAALARFQTFENFFHGGRFSTFYRTGGFASCSRESEGFALLLPGASPPGGGGGIDPPVALASAVIRHEINSSGT